MADRIAAVDAARLIKDWGFLVEPDLPDRPGPACLLVAIRKVPTLSHYDPESVDYWVTVEGRGVPMRLEYQTPMPLDVEFSWGTLRVVDRLRVSNEYVTFGGDLTADRVDGASIATFLSPAPLLRRGGHSQGWDPGAAALGAFFARLRAAVGSDPHLEALASAADPQTRYSAFVAHFVERRRGSELLRMADVRTWRLLQGEGRRLAAEHPTEWAAGQYLLDATALIAV